MKSLPSVYRGVTYRSRLEARWAIVFDALGAGAEYEPEGFELTWRGYCQGRKGVQSRQHNYLPDFFLSRWGCWAEIKPTGGLTDDAYEKCDALAGASGRYVYVFEGPPQFGQYEVHQFTPERSDDACGGYRGSGTLGSGRKCPLCRYLLFDGGYDTIHIPSNDPRTDAEFLSDSWPASDEHSPDIARAFMAAASARFGT